MRGFRTILAPILAVALSLPAFARTPDGVAADSEIAGPPAEAGEWRTRTQQVFDPIPRTLLRKSYTVWDPAPSRRLDFVWVPRSFPEDKEGRVTGEGRLVWRFRGKPAYDPASTFAEYRGAMRAGKAEGHGTYRDQNGVEYEGEWKHSLMEGRGTLKLPSGDEYVGEFRAGKANGHGRNIDATGEIFEGRFVDGLRDGRGKTTLPNGRAYESAWTKGKESEDSRLVRIAQSGGLVLAGGADDVRLGITVDRSRESEGELQYASSNTPGGLSIRPASERLVGLWKGGAEIQLIGDEELGFDEFGVLSFSEGQLSPLGLVIEVQNRSSVPLQIAGAYVDVRASRSDLEPAIQLSVGTFEGCGGPRITQAEYLRQIQGVPEDGSESEIQKLGDYRPSFVLQNFGWGTANDAQLNFAFVNLATGEKSEAVSKNLGGINQDLKVSLESALAAAGVDTNALKTFAVTGFECHPDPGTCLDQLRATGVFGSLAPIISLEGTNIFAGAAGTLAYRWTDTDGSARDKESPFTTRLLLGELKHESECGEGGGREPITAKALDLALDQADYRLPVSFQTDVPGGRTSRFTLPLKAAKSSQHDFRIVLQLADGREIASRDINLLYYRPSWFPGVAY